MVKPAAKNSMMAGSGEKNSCVSWQCKFHTVLITANVHSYLRELGRKLGITTFVDAAAMTSLGCGPTPGWPHPCNNLWELRVWEVNGDPPGTNQMKCGNLSCRLALQKERDTCLPRIVWISKKKKKKKNKIKAQSVEILSRQTPT